MGVREAEMIYASWISFRAAEEVLKWLRIWVRRAPAVLEGIREAARAAEVAKDVILTVSRDDEDARVKLRWGGWVNARSSFYSREQEEHMHGAIECGKKRGQGMNAEERGG